MSEFILIGVVGLVWYLAMGARETAMTQARNICKGMNGQLLDETVKLMAVRLQRGAGLDLRLKRNYQFAVVTRDGVIHDGMLTLLGNTLDAVLLDTGTQLAIPEIAPNPGCGGGCSGGCGTIRPVRSRE